MRWPLFLSLMFFSGTAVAAPLPATDARLLVAKLSDESQRTRGEAALQLRNRPDATPWLRRAVRTTDRDTVRRAQGLLAPHADKRQIAAPDAINAASREGRIDLFVEWHHFWQPAEKDSLWSVMPRATKSGLDEFAKRYPAGQLSPLEEYLAQLEGAGEKKRVFDGPFTKLDGPGIWRIRTDSLDVLSPHIACASVTGPISLSECIGGRFLALDAFTASAVTGSFVASDGGLSGHRAEFGTVRGPRVAGSFVVCRGDATVSRTARHAVVLVDGDIDLSQVTEIKDSLIRASGAIRLPKGVRPVNCTIEAHAKNATAPYKFFELADVGLALADDEEGLVVTGAKADTPFGNCGIAKGDIILAIDDAPAGHSEEFRKLVRRALVRQGDCLLTVVRNGKTLDLPVFFPLPK